MSFEEYWNLAEKEQDWLDDYWDIYDHDEEQE